MIRILYLTLLTLVLSQTAIAIPPAQKQPTTFNDAVSSLWDDVKQEPVVEPVKPPAPLQAAAAPVVVPPSTSDGLALQNLWQDFDPNQRLLEDLARRVEKLEKTQLTEADVIRIVETNFAVMRIRRNVGGKTQEVAIASDIVEDTDEEVRVPGFAGTFTVPKGGTISSITVWENGQFVEKKLSSGYSPVTSNGVKAYRGVAENMTVYASPSPTVQGAVQVTTYNTAQLQSFVPSYRAAAPPVQRRLFGRVLNPAVRRVGSQCSQAADGSWSFQ